MGCLSLSKKLHSVGAQDIYKLGCERRKSTWSEGEAFCPVLGEGSSASLSRTFGLSSQQGSTSHKAEARLIRTAQAPIAGPPENTLGGGPTWLKKRRRRGHRPTNERDAPWALLPGRAASQDCCWGTGEMLGWGITATTGKESQGLLEGDRTWRGGERPPGPQGRWLGLGWGWRGWWKERGGVTRRGTGRAFRGWRGRASKVRVEDATGRGGQNTYQDVGPQDLVAQSWAASSHKDPLFPPFDILRILPCSGVTCCCSQDFHQARLLAFRSHPLAPGG